METTLVARLYESTALTFESMGFLFATPEPDEHQLAAPVDVAVRVDFRGPLTGSLEVHVAGGILPVIAANMLGEDLAPGEPLERDALGEIANVICGNVLPALAGPRAVFDLGSPVVVGTGPQLAGRGAPEPGTAVRVRIGLEAGRADVMLRVAGRPVPEAALP